MAGGGFRYLSSSTIKFKSANVISDLCLSFVANEITFDQFEKEVQLFKI
jgi:hypothetical protein